MCMVWRIPVNRYTSAQLLSTSPRFSIECDDSSRKNLPSGDAPSGHEVKDLTLASGFHTSNGEAVESASIKNG